ncbi:MAG: hypothetical protein ACI4SG_03115 [Oligosphaeraceae bacterium]
MPCFYVYILTDAATGARHYTGHATGLQERLARRHRGAVPAASKDLPWRINTAVAFADEKVRASCLNGLFGEVYVSDIRKHNRLRDDDVLGKMVITSGYRRGGNRSGRGDSLSA